MVGWFAAIEGEHEVVVVVAVAKEFDEAQVATAYLQVDGSDVAGWDVAGTGEVFSDGSSTLVVVLAFPNEAAAGRAVAELRSIVETGTSLVTGGTWSHLLSIQSIDADGPVVVGRFTNSSPGLAGRIVLTRDNLLDVG